MYFIDYVLENSGYSTSWMMFDPPEVLLPPVAALPV